MTDDTEEDYMAARRREVALVVGKVIARAWSDETFKQALIKDPQPLLHAEGLYFPERYTIEFYDDPSASPGDWSSVGRGLAAVHRFPIPPCPHGAQLAREVLEGGEDSAACCSPCASCTGAAGPETWG
jgi:hypothetical protein